MADVVTNGVAENVSGQHIGKAKSGVSIVFLLLLIIQFYHDVTVYNSMQVYNSTIVV